MITGQKLYDNNVFGVYRPHDGEEMPITVEWIDGYYHITVVGADIELLVDDEEADGEQEAFDICEEDIGRELTRYAFSRGAK
jgi:hypothetical protein